MSSLWDRTRRTLHRVRAASHDDAGQGLAEYALILALVALMAVAGVQALGNAIASSGAWTLP